MSQAQGTKEPSTVQARQYVFLAVLKRPYTLGPSLQASNVTIKSFKQPLSTGRVCSTPRQQAGRRWQVPGGRPTTHPRHGEVCVVRPPADRRFVQFVATSDIHVDHFTRCGASRTARSGKAGLHQEAPSACHEGTNTCACSGWIDSKRRRRREEQDCSETGCLRFCAH